MHGKKGTFLKRVTILKAALEKNPSLSIMLITANYGAVNGKKKD